MDSEKSGGVQNLERPHVETTIFRNFEISNIRITKDEIFDFFYFLIDFSFFYLFNLFEHSIYTTNQI